MPRRKRTRGGKAKPTVKCKEIEDLNDVSMCSTTSEVTLSKEEIMARVIEDFTFGVETKIHHIRAMMNKAISDQKNFLKMELLKIPKEVRKMKVSEFVGAGNDMNELIINVIKPVEEPPVAFTNQENIPPGHQQPASTAKSTRTTRKTRATKTPMVTQTTERPTRGAKTRATAAISCLATPANGSKGIPIITPKVPPSMCMTASRNPKVGEMMFSLAGSPVTVAPNNKNMINLAIKDGKSNLDISGAILEMSPNSLAQHTDPLLKLKDFIDSRLQQIEKSTGYVSTVKKPKGKMK